MTRMRTFVLLAALPASGACTVTPDTGRASAPSGPMAGAWMDASLSTNQRADALVSAMTRAEKLTMVFGYFGTDFPPKNYTAPAKARDGSTGYVPGIPRLGVPAQWQTDAGIGVATQGGAAVKKPRTALPSGLATTATWNPEIAFRGGAMIGSEARSSGFNVMLAGGVNLLREAENGRNFGDNLLCLPTTFVFAADSPWLCLGRLQRGGA